MDVCIVHIFRPCVDSDLVDGQVVVGQLSFQIADFLPQILESVFELVVDVLLLGDFVPLLLEVLDLAVNQLKPLFELINVVVPVVDLSAGVAAQVVDRDTLVRDWAVHDVDIGGCANTHHRHASSRPQTSLWDTPLPEVVCELGGASTRPALNSLYPIACRFGISILKFQIFDEKLYYATQRFYGHIK